jgi:hypothetical protein
METRHRIHSANIDALRPYPRALCGCVLLVSRPQYAVQIHYMALLLPSRDSNVCNIDLLCAHDRVARVVRDVHGLSLLVCHHSLGIPRLSEVQLLPRSSARCGSTFGVSPRNTLLGELDCGNTALLRSIGTGDAVQSVGCEAGSPQVRLLYFKRLLLLILCKCADPRNSQASRSLLLDALVKLGFGEYQTRKAPVEQDRKDLSQEVEPKSFYDRT